MFIPNDDYLQAKQHVESKVDPINRQFRLQKLKVYRKQDGKCCFCQVQMILCADCSVDQFCTWEHVDPFHVHRDDSLENKKLSCYKCNNERGPIPYSQFLAMRIAGWSSKILHQVRRSYELETKGCRRNSYSGREAWTTLLEIE